MLHGLRRNPKLDSWLKNFSFHAQKELRAHSRKCIVLFILPCDEPEPESPEMNELGLVIAPQNMSSQKLIIESGGKYMSLRMRSVSLFGQILSYLQKSTHFCMFSNWPNFFLQWNWKLRLQIWAFQEEYVWSAIFFFKIFSNKIFFLFLKYFLKYFRKFRKYSKKYFENKLKLKFEKILREKFGHQMNSFWKAQICNLSFQFHRRKKLDQFEKMVFLVAKKNLNEAHFEPTL